MVGKCEDCAVCCEVADIKELQKPSFQKCRYLKSDADGCGGCSIYEERPSVCSDFFCGYLTAELPEHLRPDISGVFFLPSATTADGETIEKAMRVYELRPGAIEDKEIIRAINSFAKDMVVVVSKDKAEPHIILFGNKHSNKELKASRKLDKNLGFNRQIIRFLPV